MPPPARSDDVPLVPRPVLLAAAALFLLCAATAPFLPLFDPDEGYYAATASESLAAHAPWDLRFNHQPRWDKPLLPYALIEGGFELIGENRTAARLPSAVEGALLALIVGAIVARLAGARAGSLSAAILATTIGVQAFARAAHPEIAVVLAIAATELLTAVWFTTPAERRPMWLPFGAGVSMAYGILAKGPVAVALPALAAVVVAPFAIDVGREWRSAVRDAAIAAAVAFVLAAPWYAAMTIRHGSVFLQEALWNQNVGRYTTALYGHRASVVYFVVPAAVGMMPWTAFVPAAFRRALRRGRESRQILRMSAAAAAATAFIFYSASTSKLASYALVFVPPLAILVALYLDEELRAARPVRTRAETLTAVLLMATGILLLLVPLLVYRVFSPRELLGGVPGDDRGLLSLLWRAVFPVTALFIAGGVVVLTASRRVRLAAMFAVGAVVPFVAVLVAGPLLGSIYPWESFGRDIRSGSGPVWILGYRAPSLTFYASRPVERVADPERLAHLLASPTTTGWVVLDAHQFANLSHHPAIQRERLHVVRTGGRMVLVRVTNSELRIQN